MERRVRVRAARDRVRCTGERRAGSGPDGGVTDERRYQARGGLLPGQPQRCARRSESVARTRLRAATCRSRPAAESKCRDVLHLPLLWIHPIFGIRRRCRRHWRRRAAPLIEAAPPRSVHAVVGGLMLIADQLRDPFADARAFVERGRASEQRAPAEAIGWYDRALTTLSGQWSEMLVDVLRWKGTAHRDCGDTAEAERLYDRSAEIAKELGYATGEAHVTNCRAIIAHRRGDLIAALQLYWEAATLARRTNDTRLLAMTERNLGALAAMRGRPEQALSHYEESLKVAQSVGDEDGVSHTLNNIALLYSEFGQHRDAEEILAGLLDTARTRGDVAVECIALINLGELRLRMGRYDLAESACLDAMTIAHQRGDRLRRAEALRIHAEIWAVRGDLERCATAIDEALLLTRDGEDAILAAEIWRVQALLERVRGAAASERLALDKARDLFTRAGAWQQVAAVDAAIARLS